MLRSIASHWPTGVAVITTTDCHGNHKGLTMTAVTSLSLDPQQFLICVDERSTTLAPILESRRFCINFLAAGQEDLARLFASKKVDKFDGVAWELEGIGLPALTGAVAQAGCEVVAVYEGGDHRIIVGALRAATINGGEPLVYQAGKFMTTKQEQSI